MLENYNFVSIDDLRYDLERIEALTELNIAELDDDMVLLLHHQILNAGDPEAPEFYKSDVEFWINLERNVVMNYQSKIQALTDELNKLKTQLGYSVDGSNSYASSSD